VVFFDGWLIVGCVDCYKNHRWCDKRKPDCERCLRSGIICVYRSHEFGDDTKQVFEPSTGSYVQGGGVSPMEIIRSLCGNGSDVSSEVSTIEEDEYQEVNKKVFIDETNSVVSKYMRDDPHVDFCISSKFDGVMPIEWFLRLSAKSINDLGVSMDLQRSRCEGMIINDLDNYFRGYVKCCERMEHLNIFVILYGGFERIDIFANKMRNLVRSFWSGGFFEVVDGQVRKYACS